MAELRGEGAVVTFRREDGKDGKSYANVGIALDGALFECGVARGSEDPKPDPAKRCVLVMEVGTFNGRASLRFKGTEPLARAA